MLQNENVYDVVIIGGGPAGLFTAFYAGMRNMSVKIIESLPQLGGQLSALYPEKYIYDVAGFPTIRAQELVNNLIEQMKMFAPAVSLEQSVKNVEKQSDGIFKLTTKSGDVHYARTIIITAGNGAFNPRKLKLADVEKYEKKNLHYYIDSLNKFKDKEIVVFGGGDSAVDWSLMLEPIAKKVTLVHRRDVFRAHEHSVEKLKQSAVEVLTPFVPTALNGKNKIEQVVLGGVKAEEEIIVEADEVLVNYGFVSSLGSIKDWDLNIEKNSIIVNSKMETNVEGIYAVGDINTYEGKMKLIATGFGEAPVAVSNAKVYINPDEKVQPVHSTRLMEEKEKRESVPVY